MFNVSITIEELSEIASHREFSSAVLKMIKYLADEIIVYAKKYGNKPYDFEILITDASAKGSARAERFSASISLKIDAMNRTNYYMQFDADNGTSYPRVHRMHDRSDATVRKFLLDDLELAFQDFARDMGKKD